MKLSTLKGRLFFLCTLLSIAVHGGAVWVLYYNPLYIGRIKELCRIGADPSLQFALKEDQSSPVDRVEEALAESLNHAIALAPSTQLESLAEGEPPASQEGMGWGSPIARSESVAIAPLFDPSQAPSLLDFALDDPIDSSQTTPSSIDFYDPYLLESISLSVIPLTDDHTIDTPPLNPFTWPVQSIVDLRSFTSSIPPSVRVETGSSIQEDEEIFAHLPENTTPPFILPSAVDYLRNQWVKRSLAEQIQLSLERYGVDELTAHFTWEEGIDLQATIMPDLENSRYIFSLLVYPRQEANIAPIDHHFYFVIDRSHSIEKTKINRFKRAVQRALSALRQGDSFNVIFFDKEVVKLSETNLSLSPQNIEMAEHFLEKQSSQKGSSLAELETSIDQIFPTHFSPNGHHSIILISDGKNLLHPSKQKRVLSQWSKRFGGNINIYSAAAGKGNNLVLLDLLSYATGGKLLYSDTNAGFPRKLVQLVGDLHAPLANQLSVELIPNDPNARVVLYPPIHCRPTLFAKQPYLIVGTIDEICDMTLLMQGSNPKQPLNIRKLVSFKEAAKGGRLFEKTWAESRAKICYEKFLNSGDKIHLKQAQQIVAPHQGAIATEQ